MVLNLLNSSDLEQRTLKRLNIKMSYFQAISATLSCILCLRVGTMSQGCAWWMQTESSCRAVANFGAWGCHAKQGTTLLDLLRTANYNTHPINSTFHNTCKTDMFLIGLYYFHSVPFKWHLFCFYYITLMYLILMISHISVSYWKCRKIYLPFSTTFSFIFTSHHKWKI